MYFYLVSNKDIYYYYYYHYFFIIIITEVQFSDWTKTLCNKTKRAKEILSFVTAYNPATPNLKKVLMKHWHIIQQQPRLAHIFNQPLIVSYRKEKPLKDILVRVKLPSTTPQS